MGVAREIEGGWAELEGEMGDMEVACEIVRGLETALVSGLIFCIVTWTSGIDNAEPERRGFLAGPRSKLRQCGGL